MEWWGGKLFDIGMVVMGMMILYLLIFGGVTLVRAVIYWHQVSNVPLIAFGLLVGSFLLALVGGLMQNWNKEADSGTDQ